MKQFLAALAFVVMLTPVLDTTPDSVPHTYCFDDGSCYQGSQTGNDSTITNIQNPSDVVTQPQSVSAVCFETVCYQLDSKGILQ